MKTATTRRGIRLADQILRELATMLVREVADPRLELVSLTTCRLNTDMTVAEVAFTVGGGPERRKEALEGLNRAKGFLRSSLGRKIKMRFLPELRFVYDDFLEDMVYAKPHAADR